MKEKEIRLLQVLAVSVLILSVILSGCSGFKVKKPGALAGNFDEKTPRIGMIVGEGGIGDPFYSKAWEGLERAEEELGVGIGYVKAGNEKEYPAKLAELKEKECELIFTFGQELVPAVLEAAKANPGIKYVCLDAGLDKPVPDNVLGITFKEEEAAFLAGYIAGKITQTNVIGFIGGQNDIRMQKYYYGYKAGIRSANHNCELMKGIAGTYTNKNRVQEMAERMYECDADVIFHAAGSAGKGMIKAARKEGKYAIGSEIDQNDLAPENVLTSVVKRTDEVTYQTVRKFKEGELVFGQNLQYGLAEGGVDLAESTPEHLPEKVYNQVLKYREKIIAGKITVPSNEREYLAFADN